MSSIVTALHTGVRDAANAVDPVGEAHFSPVDLLAGLVPVRRRDVDQRRPVVRVFAGSKKDARLFEALADGAQPVGMAVFVPLARVARRDLALVEGVQVPAGEHVRRRKGRRRLDPVQQEDLVRRREEQDTAFRVSWLAGWLAGWLGTRGMPCMASSIIKLTWRSAEVP